MDMLIKSPIEKFPVYFNFSSDFLSNEVISTATITCVNAATGISSKTAIIDSEAIFTPEVSAVLKAGTEGDEHQIQCVITTSLGNKYQRDLLLIVQSVVTDSFNKQPSDMIMFDVDFTRRLEVGDTLSTAVVLVIKEADGSDVSTTVAPFVEVITPKCGVRVAEGSDGETYLLRIQGTSTAGYVYEKILRMTVQERP